MNSLPNYDRAWIEDSKLTDYALNPRSERGQHKARLFASRLGFDLSNWQMLRQAVLAAIPHHTATLTSETPFGMKYQVLLPITGPNGQRAEVMTIWQFDRRPDGTLAGEPRLVTIYVQ
jgi:hypothetical protein